MVGGVDMLLFSDYLHELLEKKGLTVSALARISGVERTTLSKTLAGQRVLPYDALNHLVYHLKLTPGEEKRFRNYYDAQFEQEGRRRSRELVGRAFADLTNLDFFPPAFEEVRLLMTLAQYAGERSVFAGTTNVQPLLRMALTEELSRADAQLLMTVPPSDTFLRGELLQRCLSGRMRAEIIQIIALDASGAAADINLHNLEYFCSMLPLCLLSRRSYHPYYYYSDRLSDHFAEPFPYFVVTHSCVICLSEDSTRAMLLRAPDQISGFQRHFFSLLSRCYSLIQYTADPVEVLASYDAMTDASGFYMIMDQPCFGRFYDASCIREYLRRDLPFYAQLEQAAQQRFGRLRTVEQFYTLFSLRGLQRFLDTGMLDDFPEAFVRPFPPEQRQRLLAALTEQIRTGGVQGRLLEPGVFPDYLSMVTSAHGGVGFFTTENFPLQDGFCSIHVQEPNLCRAFHHWLVHLPDGSETLTAKETAETMEKLLRRGVLAP